MAPKKDEGDYAADAAFHLAKNWNAGQKKGKKRLKR
jgi:hypothetical protein